MLKMRIVLVLIVAVVAATTLGGWSWHKKTAPLAGWAWDGSGNETPPATLL